MTCLQAEAARCDMQELAQQFCGSSEAITRVDCSELMERHSVSKLIGSPPGEGQFCNVLLQNSSVYRV